MRELPRLVERWLAQSDGGVTCSRTQARVAGCADCLWFCRRDDSTSSVVCSYPIPARDTFARRATRDHATRIALGHGLVRT